MDEYAWIIEELNGVHDSILDEEYDYAKESVLLIVERLSDKKENKRLDEPEQNH